MCHVHFKVYFFGNSGNKLLELLDDGTRTRISEFGSAVEIEQVMREIICICMFKS